MISAWIGHSEWQRPVGLVELSVEVDQDEIIGAEDLVEAALRLLQPQAPSLRIAQRHVAERDVVVPFHRQDAVTDGKTLQRFRELRIDSGHVQSSLCITGLVAAVRAGPISPSIGLDESRKVRGAARERVLQAREPGEQKIDVLVPVVYLTSTG